MKTELEANFERDRVDAFFDFIKILFRLGFFVLPGGGYEGDRLVVTVNLSAVRGANMDEINSPEVVHEALERLRNATPAELKWSLLKMRENFVSAGAEFRFPDGRIVKFHPPAEPLPIAGPSGGHDNQGGNKGTEGGVKSPPPVDHETGWFEATVRINAVNWTTGSTVGKCELPNGTFIGNPLLDPHVMKILRAGRKPIEAKMKVLVERARNGKLCGTISAEDTRTSLRRTREKFPEQLELDLPTQ